MALPPTTPALLDDAARPYFLWWTDLTVGEYRRRLESSSSTERAYWLGALLREANSRDVWLFTTPDEVRLLWPELRRHLGRTRALGVLARHRRDHASTGRWLVLDRFDRRVVPDSAIEFVRACQGRVDCHLGGGVALAGAYLGHRLSNDLDLFVHDRAAHRILVSVLSDVAADVSGRVEIRLDAGTSVRAELKLPDHALELDVVFEAAPDIESPPKLEGVSIESLADLRAAKLNCLLSRSEPRDLVDVLFLERSGHRPEDDFELALRRDAGMDPGILAWLLNDFPIEPMPMMVLPLERAELLAYRDELRDRFKRMATAPA